MSDLNPTIAIEDGVAYAVVKGQVVASGTDEDAVLKEAHTRLAAGEPATVKTGTHIVTPGGVRGEILGRTPGLWGEEVTVRFEDGKIHTMAVTARTQFVTSKTAATTNPVERIEERIAATYSGDRESLVTRFNELKRLQFDAHKLANSGIGYEDKLRLDEASLQARHESAEIHEAIDHLDATAGEGFVPPAPFHTEVVQQAQVGTKADTAWLDQTVETMLDEARATDYHKLLDEGPALVAAELSDGQVADAGTSRAIASRFVRSKTAGTKPEVAEEYEAAFLARVEDARRVELAARAATTKREAATKKEVTDSASDSAIFM